jgi:hypothetical protein
MEDGSGTCLVNPYAINRQTGHRESPHFPDLFYSMGLANRLDTEFGDAKKPNPGPRKHPTGVAYHLLTYQR